MCRAKCDELLCAAKVLHRALFQGHHGGENVAIQKFEQECSLLSSIKHPCVVQYLGTYPHPTTRLPVLLMELMDESLTCYLEKSATPFPFHIEVNICHDVAMAIAYLHNNSLIHRDISSNNVLQNDPPVYSEKLDVFSFGVLSIQVMTRKFPEPDAQRKKIPDSRYPTGIVEIPIPDQERRKAHISLISTTHPLLSIALQCIEFEEQGQAHRLWNEQTTC